MPIFKVGDLVVTPPEANKEYWTPAKIVTIINPDTAVATLVCESMDGDLVYLGVNEVVHYDPSFTNNEHEEKVNTREIKVGDLVEVISKPNKEWADGMSVGDRFVVYRIGKNTEGVPEGVRSVHSETDYDGYSCYFPENCVRLVEETPKNTDFVTNAEGGVKADGNKPRPTILLKDLGDAVNSVINVLEYGAKKYHRMNYSKVETERYEDSISRHLMAYLAGEKNDPESGEHHLAHLVCGALFIIQKGD